MKPVWTVTFVILFLLTLPTGGGQAGEDSPKTLAEHRTKFTQALILLASNEAADIDHAMMLLERAASDGAPVHVILGDLYSRGTKTRRDFQKAAKWYRIAAESGDGIGQLEYGKLRLAGRGVSIDIVEAILYLQLARERLNDTALKREADKILSRAKRQASLEDWRDVKKRLNHWQPKTLDELLN